MTVVYCADRNLYPYLPTTINSLLQNNPQVKKIYLLIEDNNIPYINHSKIEFINCNNFDFLIRDGYNCTERFPYMTLTRCFLSRILKEDKILYLDVDTIICENIQEIWETDLKDTYIAGFQEHGTDYINSGVMLMNLQKIRNSQPEKVLFTILKTCCFELPDQDALNYAFKNKKTYLPYKYNAIGKEKEVYKFNFLIRHFAGTHKPWGNKPIGEKDKRLWNKYYVKEIKEN